MTQRAWIPRICKMPAEVRDKWTLKEWVPDQVTIYPSPVSPVADIGITPEELFGRFSDALRDPALTLHVSPAGSDDNDGWSEQKALKSIHRASAIATAAHVRSVKIYVHGRTDRRPAEYGNSLRFGDVTCDTAFIAIGGTINVGTWLEFNPRLFTRDPSCPALYSMPCEDADRVIDRTVFTERFSHPELQELKPVADRAGVQVTARELVAITPGSWACEEGLMYIRRADGQSPTPRNTRIFPPSGPCLDVTKRVNVFVGGHTTADIWEIEGGSRNVIQVLSPEYPGGSCAVVFSGVAAGYGGRWWTGANAFGIDGIMGLAALFNCRAFACSADGFNAHSKKVEGVSRKGKTHFVTVNCTAIDNGRGVSSSNGWTLHENVVGLEFAGVYRWNHGGTIGNTHQSFAWLAGTVVSDDLGDTYWGSIASPQALKMGKEAACFLDGVTMDMPAATFTYRNGYGRVVLQNMPPPRAPAVGPLEQELEPSQAWKSSLTAQHGDHAVPRKRGLFSFIKSRTPSRRPR